MKPSHLLSMGALLASVGWSSAALAQGAVYVGGGAVQPGPPAAPTQIPPQPVGPVYPVQPGQTVYVQPPANGQPGAPVYVQPAQPVPGPGSVYVQPGQNAPGGQPTYVYPPGPQQPMYAPPLAPPPPVRQVIRYDMRPRYGLIIAGAVTLGVTYLIHAGTASLVEVGLRASGDTRTIWTNYIPVLGPWITMGTVPQGITQGLSFAGLAFSGLAQTAGLAMLIAGAASRERVPVYALNSRIQLLPSIGPTGTGLALAGNF